MDVASSTKSPISQSIISYELYYYFLHHNQLRQNLSAINQCDKPIHCMSPFLFETIHLPGRTIVSRLRQTTKGNQLIDILREILCCYNKQLPGRTIVGRSRQTTKGNQLIVISREILCWYNKRLPGRTIIGRSKHTKHSPIINTQCIYDYFELLWKESSLS